MFDFYRWCAWAEAQCQQSSTATMTMEFRLGGPTAKRSAAVGFHTDRLIMDFMFWETGEADFFGVETLHSRDVTAFNCILLNDTTFEAVFHTCVSAVAGSDVSLASEPTDPTSGQRIPSGYDS